MHSHSHSSATEADDNNLVKKSRHQQEINLAELSRKRYNNLILAFKLFFTSLTLITLALITYLVQSQSLDDSIHHNPPSLQIYNPINTTQIFNLSLQSAAQELEYATSLILSASNEDAKNELAFNNCRRWLQIGSGQIRAAIRANPFPGRSSDQQRVEMENRIVAAEGNINSCLDDLAAAAESTAAMEEVRAAVVAAAAYLGERGDFLMSYRAKMLRKLRETVAENLIVICLLGFQMLFIFFLFWTIIRSN